MTDADKALLNQLKEQATSLGITYSPNIGIETLKKKIEDKLGKSEVSESKPSTSTATSAPSVSDLKADALALVRIKLTNLDPNDRDLKSETFTMVNRVVGKISRTIPFNRVWHVEKCLLDSIMDTKFIIANQSDDESVPEKAFVSKYHVEILSPLTEKELRELAKEQAAGNRIDQD